MSSLQLSDDTYSQKNIYPGTPFFGITKTSVTLVNIGQNFFN